MTSKEAILSLTATGISKYGIAKALGAFPVSVDQWLTGTKMSEGFKKRIKEVYDIDVNDTVRTPVSTS